VLFPRGQVSPRQRHQLACWGDNVRSFEVAGTFDDCQAMVKGAFADPEMSAAYRLGAANSINIGRLLPQLVYHAAASLWHWREAGTVASFIVPTGNLGNAMACVWARAIGMPIGHIILATNANRTIPDFLATGDWQPRPSVQTPASAMDVGNPSNMERLRHLFPDLGDLRQAVEAYPVEDAAIRAQIARDFERYGDIWCPHTATALRAYDELPAARRRGEPWIVIATAHPAKFDNIVEPIIGRPVDVPPALAQLLRLPVHAEPIDANLDALRAAMRDW
jgi:threonine synthase